MCDGARDSFGLGRGGNGRAVSGSDEAKMRGIQGVVSVGDILWRRVRIDRRYHEGLGVGVELGLEGDFVLVVSFVDGHPAVSPPNGGVEEAQEWVANDDAEVGRYHAEGQCETQLSQCSADDNIVGAMHQTTVGCADVTGSGEVSTLKAEVRG